MTLLEIREYEQFMKSLKSINKRVTPLRARVKGKSAKKHKPIQNQFDDDGGLIEIYMRECSRGSKQENKLGLEEASHIHDVTPMEKCNLDQSFPYHCNIQDADSGDHDGEHEIGRAHV